MSDVVSVVHEPFDFGAIDELFSSSEPLLPPGEIGAFVEFRGVVRRTSPERTVVAMTYDGHPALIRRVLGEVIAEVRARAGVALACAVAVRLGCLKVGEASLVIRTGSRHRPPAYAANLEILEALKARAPIWKCEHAADGSRVWLDGCCLRSDHVGGHRHAHAPAGNDLPPPPAGHSHGHGGCT